jgi:hypothetical protein
MKKLDVRLKRKGDIGMADKKNIIDHRRIRKIVGSFSWLDHRLITGGFLDELSATAILLYFFLTAVSDRHGVSFYHDDRICRILKIDLHSLGQVRADLINRGLIAYRYPVYQVLALPEKPITPPTAQELAEQKKKRDLYYIQKIKDVVSRGGRRQLC